jgi:PAS domain S-box-containing protein
LNRAFALYGKLMKISPRLIGLTVFVVLLSITVLVFKIRVEAKNIQEMERLETSMEEASSRLRENLNQSLSVTKSLNFIIENYGVPDNFDAFCEDILSAHQNIQAIEVVEKGVISKVYPLQGNEAALGYDIFKDSMTANEAMEALKRNDLFFAGPLNLKQGGSGVVGRLPIFKNDTFKGFSAVVIRLDSLLCFAGIYPSVDSNINFQLSKRNPNNGKMEYFVDGIEMADLKRKISKIKVPDGEWELSASYVGNTWVPYLPFLVAGLILSVLTGWFITYRLKQPIRLNQLVEEKILQLEESRRLMDISQVSAKVGSWKYEAKTGVLKLNEVSQNILSWPDDEWFSINKLYSMFLDPKILDEFKLSFQKAVKNGESFREDVMIKDHKSNVKWVRITGTGELQSDQSSIVYGAIQDINFHKLIEEEREDILDSITDAFVAFDNNWRITYWNKASEKMFHRDSSEMLHQNIWEVSNERLDGNLKEEMEYAMNNKVPRSLIWYFEHNKIWTEISFFPKHNGLTAYLKNITENILHMEAIETQNRNLKEIAWTQSHVVRVPLAKLIASVDLLTSEKDEKERKKLMELIMKLTSELDVLIKDISDKTIPYRPEEEEFTKASEN